MYCVAEFIKTAETEVVPTKWVNKQSTKCFWPYYKGTDRIKKAILSSEIPDPEKWDEYDTRILHKYNTYQEARSHLSKAVYTSHLDSEEDNECRRKRKRISKTWSSSEESVILKKQKQNKNKSKIRSPPTIRFDKCTLDKENFVNSLAELPRESSSSSIIATTSMNDDNNDNGNNGYRDKRRMSEIYSSSEDSFVSKNSKQNKNRSEIKSPKITSFDKSTSNREDSTLNSNFQEESCGRNFMENENFSSFIMPTTSSMNNNKNAGEPLLLLILKKLRKLDYVQNNVIIPDIQEVLNYIKPQRLEVQETNVPITLPIDNDIQLNEFEQYISTTENYRIMILKFSHIGGHGTAGITRKIMKNLITSKFAMNFNWGGKAPKRPFKELKSMHLLLDSVRKVIPSASTEEIESAIKDWLKQAKTRVMSYHF
ncbi:rRNA methyltransferase 2, mitochondrial isoform X2 [Solenopsis invicta]|nr:rRNA methyltransferase 2, mitochondrial isoform X2 [Solenopsis invicta]XP_039307667.1 rRNA methyltransferase 2, mitochondrial isoform X2 [Solenopsis invicta]XP_039307668.1 rRNA methyltransferase 2, mitochondrial isoform X2 [Solenopsis invicta]XP_039307669.1 rRNA methyltransferase 2, mitochondrial isoform X2 [Solenopsis invicta]XP_039307670.1 rRNA methyltransferase 2, mitochondrial isoform X2 [Solenopsis invicta]